MTVIFYDSISQFRKSLPKRGSDSYNSGHNSSKGEQWDGGQSYSLSLENLSRGKQDTQDAADKLLDKLNSEGIELGTSYWDNDRAGSIPCVPSYIAGSPDSMRRVIETTSDTTPVKIMVGVGYSAGLDFEKARNRGIAMLALCRKLEQVRPIELWVFDDCYGQDKHDGTGACAIPVIKIETSPLDMATASYALTDVAFSRQLCFEWCFKYGFNGNWSWSKFPNDPWYNTELRRVLKAEPQDIVLPGGFMLDQLVTKPVEWVNDQLKKFTNTLALEDNEI